MSKQIVTTCALVLCALVLYGPAFAPAGAAEIDWISNNDGFWDYGPNWDGGVPPGSSDDAKHTTKSSIIKVRYGQSCLSFEGDAAAPIDRFLLIESGEVLTIGTGGLYKANGVTPYNFAVKFQDGDDEDLTELIVGGDVSGINLVPDTDQEFEAVYINLDIGGEVSGSTIELGDHCTVAIDEDADACSITLGDPDGTYASRTIADIGGDMSGVPLLTLKGYTQLTVAGDMMCDGPDDTITLQDHAALVFDGSLFVDQGTWTVEESAGIDASEQQYFRPNDLTVDGQGAWCTALVLGQNNLAWDLTIKNSGAVTAITDAGCPTPSWGGGRTSIADSVLHH